ncbi:MAG: cell division protein FtsZ [Bacteroidaceae bacterium]|nr:cell division protein FtsZ [Bacteroidaceae bacterium]
MPFDFPQTETKDLSENIIKVIGVGGGGSNAVKNMYKQGVHNVSFAICNTDSQALSKAEIPVKIQLGSAGLGVGGKPEKGREAAEASLHEIESLFDNDTRMVFVTCGMGGGTGTGAAPVIAKVARDKGLLTVGVVTIPFAFEKRVRIEKALLGVEEMRKNVDALLVINNERLCDIYADGMTTVEQAFAKADDILTVAAKSISEIITTEGIVNRDFCDVETVMKDGGDAIMSVGRASGEHRIEKAFIEALNSPLLNNMEIERARRLLYIIYSADESQVTMTELREINGFMDDLAPNIEVLWGLYRDNSLDQDVKVTIIATDFEKGEPEDRMRKEDKDRKLKDELVKNYYGANMGRYTKKAEPKVELAEPVAEAIAALAPDPEVAKIAEPVVEVVKPIVQEPEPTEPETMEPEAKEPTKVVSWRTKFGELLRDKFNKFEQMLDEQQK